MLTPEKYQNLAEYYERIKVLFSILSNDNDK